MHGLPNLKTVAQFLGIKIKNWIQNLNQFLYFFSFRSSLSTGTLKNYYAGNTITDFDIQRTVHRDIFL